MTRKIKQFGDYYRDYTRTYSESPLTEKEKTEKTIMALAHYCDDLSTKIAALEENYKSNRHPHS